MKSLSFKVKKKKERIIYGSTPYISFQMEYFREKAEAWGCGTAIVRKTTRREYSTANGWWQPPARASVLGRNLEVLPCLPVKSGAGRGRSADGIFLVAIAADRSVLGAASISVTSFGWWTAVLRLGVSPPDEGGKSVAARAPVEMI